MTQYNSLNVKLSSSELNKLKSAIKRWNGSSFEIIINIVGDEDSNFPYKLLSTDRQLENSRKAFANKSSTDIKLLKI